MASWLWLVLLRALSGPYLRKQCSLQARLAAAQAGWEVGCTMLAPGCAPLKQLMLACISAEYACFSMLAVNMLVMYMLSTGMLALSMLAKSDSEVCLF